MHTCLSTHERYIHISHTRLPHTLRSYTPRNMYICTHAYQHTCLSMYLTWEMYIHKNMYICTHAYQRCVCITHERCVCISDVLIGMCAYVHIFNTWEIHTHLSYTPASCKCAWVMSFVHESCHLCMSHVIRAWVMSFVHEVRAWDSRCVWVMSHTCVMQTHT